MYDTKVIKTDGDSPIANPIPQHFNPAIDDYEPTYGRNNAIRTELYDNDGNPVSNSAPVPTTMTTVLDSDYDSIDVDKMGKGGIVTAHDSITATATSVEVDCRGYNSLLLQVNLSDSCNWTFKVQGCMTSGGTFVDCYEANTGAMALMSYQCNASRIFVFKGIPDYIKIVATEDADGATVTVKVQPLNL